MRCCDCKYRNMCAKQANDITYFGVCEILEAFKITEIDPSLQDTSNYFKNRAKALERALKSLFNNKNEPCDFCVNVNVSGEIEPCCSCLFKDDTYPNWEFDIKRFLGGKE